MAVGTPSNSAPAKNKWCSAKIAAAQGAARIPASPRSHSSPSSGAGNSHVQGEYQDNVRRGLDFLLRSQAADGSLFGDATLYAQMYCHSMATFALAESQAVTGDRRIGRRRDESR